MVSADICPSSVLFGGGKGPKGPKGVRAGGALSPVTNDRQVCPPVFPPRIPTSRLS
jgi:hypothetical protein